MDFIYSRTVQPISTNTGASTDRMTKHRGISQSGSIKFSTPGVGQSLFRPLPMLLRHGSVFTREHSKHATRRNHHSTAGCRAGEADPSGTSLSVMPRPGPAGTWACGDMGRSAVSCQPCNAMRPIASPRARVSRRRDLAIEGASRWRARNTPHLFPIFILRPKLHEGFFTPGACRAEGLTAWGRG